MVGSSCFLFKLPSEEMENTSKRAPASSMEYKVLPEWESCCQEAWPTPETVERRRESPVRGSKPAVCKVSLPVPM